MSNKQIELTNFNASKVSLLGTNIIEASAGTGKTYSIAIMVLRLILEKKMSLSKILMVTFTKAAVAELEVRIRHFIRLALSSAEGVAIKDETIEALVQSSQARLGKTEVELRLRMARRELDQTSIFTIHGFCQKVLQEHAFETGQRFRSDVLEDVSQLIEDEVNAFWRKHITTLPKPTLEKLMDGDTGLRREKMKEAVIKYSAGKRPVHSAIDLSNITTILENQEELRQKEIDEAQQNFCNLIADCGLDWKAFMHKQTNDTRAIAAARKDILPFVDDVDAFSEKLKECQGRNCVKFIFGDFLTHINHIDNLKVAPSSVVESLYSTAASIVLKNTERYKTNLGLFSFDDLITKLHNATKGESVSQLQTLMANQYQAVFIDEFQDTDRKQYEIFHALFASTAILFFIGDPKQSIYGFRGADLATYKRAFNDCSSHYTMKTNYRSTPALIEVYNGMFGKVDSPFLDDQINYENVEGKIKKCLTRNGEEMEQPVVYVEIKNNNQGSAHLVDEVVELLTNPSYLIEGRRIRPSDIGILVRSNSKGADLKELLVKSGVPAITIDDSKVLQSDEGLFWCYALQALLEPVQGNINRFLLHPLIGRSDIDLLERDNELETIRFRKIREVWSKDGIFAACKLLLSLFSVKGQLLSNDTESSERKLSNLLQAVELLHQRQGRGHLSDTELVIWLINVHNGTVDMDGDEYVQRLESDDNAVQVVTIHKSKGLAYNIVFAPGLDLTIRDDDFKEFKDEASGDLLFGSQINSHQNEYYKKQQEQENRRLVYVALTRSVFRTYVYHSSYWMFRQSSIVPFVEAMKTMQNVEVVDASTRLVKDVKYIPTSEDIDKEDRCYSGNEIKRVHRQTSFSGLSGIHYSVPYVSQEQEDPFDAFTFHKLPRGSQSGNLLHSMFEHIAFNPKARKGSDTEQYLSRAVLRACTEFPMFAKNEVGEPQVDLYVRLINETLQSKIITEQGSFCLEQIDDNKKIPELEFSYRVQEGNMNAFAKAAGATQFNDFGLLSGMLVGFVDLFFEHEDKYYILDWKSNHIGNSLDDYNQEHISEMMRANNYDFQSLIYTVAVKRFLEQRVAGFDYEKHFGGVIYVYLRGCRSGETSGIYYNKPPLTQISEMESCLHSEAEN